MITISTRTSRFRGISSFHILIFNGCTLRYALTQRDISVAYAAILHLPISLLRQYNTTGIKVIAKIIRTELNPVILTPISLFRVRILSVMTAIERPKERASLSTMFICLPLKNTSKKPKITLCMSSATYGRNLSCPVYAGYLPSGKTQSQPSASPS